MAGFYSEQDVLFAPSIWLESYGLVSREALSAGLWVVAAQTGAMADPISLASTAMWCPRAMQQNGSGCSSASPLRIRSLSLYCDSHREVSMRWINYPSYKSLCSRYLQIIPILGA
jgi:hypothetical protein